MSILNPLSEVELDQEHAVLLPDREALAFFNIANIQALNLALAINVGSWGSAASASAVQGIFVYQH